MICVDSNENACDRKLQKALNKIGLVEASKSFAPYSLPLSYIRVSKQIDSIWISPSLIPTNLSIIPHYFSVGDHQYFIVDFPIEICMGNGFILIIKTKM